MGGFRAGGHLKEGKRSDCLSALLSQIGNADALLLNADNGFY